MVSKPNTHIFPILCLLFSAMMWGIIWYPLRLLEENGLVGLWATLVMYGVACLLGGYYLFRHWRDLLRHPWLLILLALSNAWCNVAFILAVLDGTVVRVLLLFYLSPIWAILLGMVVLGERLDRVGVITLVLAFFGAMVMLWEPDLGMPWPRDWADWLAISSGMAFAVANVLIRKLESISIAIKSTIAWYGVTLLALGWIVVAGMPLPEASMATYAWAGLLGLVAVVLMTMALQYGVTHMPIHRSAVILLFEIVAGAVSSLLLSDEQVMLVEWVGGALIIFAAYLSTRSHLHEQQICNKRLDAC